MIAECQRSNAEPRRQRDTALARRGSDYAGRLTAAVRDGRPGYRCFGWKFAVRPSIRERQLKRPTPDVGTGRLAPSAYGLGWPKTVGPLYPCDRDTFYYGSATGYSDYLVYGGTAASTA